MGKIVRFDLAQRRRVPSYKAKHARGPSFRPHRRSGHIWNPSNQAIISIGLAVFMVLSAVLYYAPQQSGSYKIRSNNAADTDSGSFAFCHTGGGYNCVVDGDTFYYRGDKIRIADIDTPETHDYGCDSELELGNAARVRLQELLNDGAFSLASIDRNTDRYGRALRVIERDGNSLGGVLVDEGLARPYAGGRRPWC